MVSYFNLELDTTPPMLEILTPNNASNKNETIVRIEANEELLDWQNIYAIDSLGKRQELTFTYNQFYFEGNAIFNFKEEVITIYVQLKDTVGNISDLVSKSIRIINGEPLHLIISENSRKLIEDEFTKKIVHNDMSRKVNQDSLTRKQDHKSIIRNHRTTIIKESPHSF